MAENNAFRQSPYERTAERARQSTGQSRFEMPDFSEIRQGGRRQSQGQAQGQDQGQEPVSGEQLLPPQDLAPVFTQAAQEHGVPVNVLMGMAQQESGYNAAAVGPQTDYGRPKGLMQYIDSTAQGEGINPFDARESVTAAARQFKQRLDQGYSPEEAIMAHYAGDDREQWGEKTREYLDKVKAKSGAIGNTLRQQAQAARPDREAIQRQLDEREPGRYKVGTREELERQQAQGGPSDAQPGEQRDAGGDAQGTMGDVPAGPWGPQSGEEGAAQSEDQQQLEEAQKDLREIRQAAEQREDLTPEERDFMLSRARDRLVGARRRLAQEQEGRGEEQEEQVDPELERTWGEAIKDVGAAWGKGSGNLLQMGGSLYGLMSGDMENWGTEYGQEVTEFYEGMESDALQERQRRRNEAVEGEEGQFNKFARMISETATDPALFTSFLVEQIPNLVTTGIGGRGTAGVAGLLGAGQRGRAIAGTAGGVGTGATMQGADAGGDAYDRLTNQQDSLWAANEAYKNLVEQGVPEEEAKERISLELSRLAAIKSAAVSTGVQMAIPGARSIERVLAGVARKGQGGLRGAATGAARGFAGESAAEGTEEAYARIASNQAVQGVNPDQETFEGAGEAAGQGALFGLFGGISGAVEGSQRRTPSAQRRRQTDEQRRSQQGPMGRAAEEGTRQAQEMERQESGEQTDVEAMGAQVRVNTPDGDIEGTISDFNDEGDGRFTAQVLADDGMLYEFTEQDGVQILRAPRQQQAEEQEAGQQEQAETEQPQAEAPEPGSRGVARRDDDDESIIRRRDGTAFPSFEQAERARANRRLSDHEVVQIGEGEWGIRPPQAETEAEAEADTYRQRNQGRMERIRQAETQTDIDQILQEEQADTERDDAGLSRVEGVATSRANEIRGQRNDLELRSDNSPFASRETAQRAIRNRRLENREAIEIDGGWAIAPISQDAESDVSADEIDTVAADTDTEPTEAQAEAGNYRKGKLNLHGLDISIENPRGSTRSGTDQDGNQWESEMAHHYGYVRGTEGRDGDHVDVFLGPESDNPNQQVFVIDQVNPETRRFDEHKAMIGFSSDQAARDGYLANYEDGWQGIGGVTQMTLDEFRQWLDSGDTKQRLTSRNEQPQQQQEETQDAGQTQGQEGRQQGREQAVQPVESDPESEAPSPTMPERVSSGLGSFEPRPIGGTLYRETDAEGVGDLLMQTLADSPEQGVIGERFVADNPDLAMGQGDNQGAFVELDGNYVSGRVNETPGSAVSEGDEYVTNYINRNAIRSFVLPEGGGLRGAARTFANRHFTREKLDDGRTLYVRKGEEGRTDEARADYAQRGRVTEQPQQQESAEATEEPAQDEGVGDPYENAETRPGATEAQRELGRSALRDFLRQFNNRMARWRAVDPDRGEAELLGARMYRDFREGESVALTGHEVTNPADLASLAQAYRDPRFETFRILAVRDGRIVSEQGVTSRLPAMVSVSGTPMANEIRRVMREQDADGYYLLHNHPSGRSDPSEADKRLTKYAASQEEGFLGHVVVDYNEYSVIDGEGQTQRFEDENLGSIDFDSSPEQPHDLLGKPISRPNEAAEVAKHLSGDPDRAVIVTTTGGQESRINSLMSMPSQMLQAMASTQDNNRRTEALAAFRRYMRATGSGGSTVIVALPDNADVNAYESLLTEGIVVDVVNAQGDSLAMTSEGFTGRARPIDASARSIWLPERSVDDPISEPSGPGYSADGDRNLFVAHNLSEENLEHALGLGGLAAPSLAVGRTEYGFGNFGNITLLAPPSILESPRARTFDADVYSPRQPRAQFKIDVTALQDQVEALDNQYSLETPDPDSVRQDGVEALLRSEAYQWQYLNEIGRAPKPKRQKVAPAVRKLANMDMSRGEMQENPEAVRIAEKHYRDVLSEIQDDAVGERRERMYFDEDGGLSNSAMTALLDNVRRYRQSGGIDTFELKRDIRKRLRSDAAQRRFREWATDKFREVNQGRLLQTGRDSYGRPRYKPYNLDNLVREMTRELRGGEGFNYGAGSVRSAYARELRNIRQIQERRDRIVDSDEMQRISDESQQRLMDTLEALKPYYKFDASGFMYADDASSAIAEGRRGQREAFNMDEDAQQIIDEFVDYLQGLPTAYFEAKVGRAVDLSEFSVAVVPRGTSQEVVKALRQKGVTVRRYDPNDPDSRRREIEKQEQVRFSFAGERSAQADPRQIESAQQRLAAGDNPEAVRRETGWFRGDDGRWRYEIDDSDAGLSDGAISDLQDAGAEGMELGQVLNHEALFAAYPDLASVRVIMDEQGMSRMGASGSYGNREIRLAPAAPESLLSTLLHEVQHGIQNIEGFAQGGNENAAVNEVVSGRVGDGISSFLTLIERYSGETVDFQPSMLEIMEPDELVDSYSRSVPRSRFDEEIGDTERETLSDYGYSFDPEMEVASVLEILADDAMSEMRDMTGLSAAEQTRRLAGETEARNVQARQRMSAEERAEAAPRETQDVAPEDVIVVFGGDEIQNAPAPANAMRAPQNPAGMSPESLQESLTSGPQGAIIRRLIDAGAVVIHERATDMPGGIEGAAAQTAADGTIHMAAENLRPRSALPTLLHEAFHEGGEALTGTEQWNRLRSQLGALYRQGSRSTGRMREFWDAARERIETAQRQGDTMSDEQVIEEFGAYAIEEYSQAPRSVQRWVDRVVGAIKAWLRRRFGIQVGQVTPAQLRAMAVSALHNNRVAEQAAQNESSGARAPQFSRAPQTDTRAFREWFGDSKVVDEEGEPKVVYHGTQSDVSDFRVPETNEAYEDGIFFTSSPRIAGNYAAGESRFNEGGVRAALSGMDETALEDMMQRARSRFRRGLVIDMEAAMYDDADTAQEMRENLINAAQMNMEEDGNPDFAEALSEMLGVDQTIPAEGANVISAYLRIENPYEVDAGGDVFDSPTQAEWVRQARSGGHDGLIIRNYDDGGTMDANNRVQQWGQHDVFMVFRPEQVKSATGNDGTFNPADPDIRRSMRPSDHFDDLNDTQKSFMNKIGPAQIRQNIGDRWRQLTDNLALRMRQAGVDRYAALLRNDRALYGDDTLENSIASSGWVLARMSHAAGGAVNGMMNSGRIYLDNEQKVIDIRENTRSLKDMFNDLGSAPEVDRFMAWVAANRAKKLEQEGRERLFTSEEIAEGIKMSRGTLEDGRSRGPLYSKAWKEFQQHRDDVLGIAEGAGIITPEQRQTWTDEFYVPFYRLMDDETVGGPGGSSGLSRQQAYQKLKGSQRRVNDLLENSLMNFHHLIQASMKNQAAVQSIDNAIELDIAEPTSENARDRKMSTFIMRNGQKEWYNISDGLTFKALSALNHPGYNNPLMKIGRAFKRLFTEMITITPQFVVANTLRDSLSAMATSPTSKVPLKSAFQGALTYGNSEARARMLASGGAFSFGHVYGDNPDEIRSSLRGNMRNARMLSDPSLIPGALMGAWRRYNSFTDFAENINRAGIWEHNIERGKLKAAFEARDLMDFSAHGDAMIVRILTDLSPFLNARIQGIDKLYRSGFKPGAKTLVGKGTKADKRAFGRFAAVSGALSLASMLLYLRNWDDEEYRKLEDWQKDTYWFVRFGDNAFFIPKPFEVGALATMSERGLEQYMDPAVGGEKFRERVGHMLSDTFALDPIPQALRPVYELGLNEDRFTGRPIENMGMRNLSPQYRTGPGTTRMAEEASEGMARVAGAAGFDDAALSPVQIDHLIQGYLGSVGSSGAGLVDSLWRNMQGEERPAKKWKEYQPIRRFYKDLTEVDRYTKYGTVFYNALQEANRAYSDIQHLQEYRELEEADRVNDENVDALSMRKALNRVQRDLSEINRDMRRIHLDDEMSGEEKRMELDRLRSLRNMITEEIGKDILQMRATADEE